MHKYKDVGDRLRRLRGSMTQPEFSKKIGVALLTYQRYEYGDRVPKGDVLARIATACAVPVDLILYGKPHEPTMKEAREFIRHSLWIEKEKHTEEDVERLAANYLSGLKAANPEPMAAETQATYGLDEVSRLILDMIKNMDEEGKRDVLKYSEKVKPYFSKQHREKRLKEG